MENWLNHERDYTFTYAGLRQVIDKYLVQDRSNGEIFETPQFMYMMIAASVFMNYPKEKRMTYVKKYYDAISTFKINIPTPVMAGCTYSSQVSMLVVYLVDSDDTLPSIFSVVIWLLDVMLHKELVSVSTLVEYEAINSRYEAVKYNILELFPFLKKFEATVKCCTQNGVRRRFGNCSLPYLAPRDRRHYCITLKSVKSFAS